MDDLCDYTYDTCRQAINLDTINDWLAFVDGIPGSDGSLSPEQTLTSVFGQYARRLRDEVFHFLEPPTSKLAFAISSPFLIRSPVFVILTSPMS